MGALTSNRRRDEPLEWLTTYWGLHDQITPEYLHAAATSYIDPARVVKVDLLPEAAPAKE